MTRGSSTAYGIAPPPSSPTTNSNRSTASSPPSAVAQRSVTSSTHRTRRWRSEPLLSWHDDRSWTRCARYGFGAASEGSASSTPRASSSSGGANGDTTTNQAQYAGRMPLSEDPPPTLYHYTDTAGLLGILGDPVSFPGTDEGTFATEKGATFGTLWATDARYLNDSQELTFGAEILAQKLATEADSATNETVRDRLQKLAADTRSGKFEYNLSSKAEKPNPHVMCFCTSGNLLSQWRGYGDGGGGYAIGFNALAIKELITVNAQLFKTYPEHSVGPVEQARRVRYGEVQAEPFLAECADEIRHDLDEIESGKKSFRWPDTFHGVIATWLAQAKHEAFEEEAEWRVIVDQEWNGEDAQFRAGRVGLIPYQKLYFPITKGGIPAVKEIIVGPGGERGLRKEALERLLEKIGSPDTEVLLSDAPYRG